MKRCLECANDGFIWNDQKYCQECGSSRLVYKDLYCWKCKSTICDHWIHCTHCGVNLKEGHGSKKVGSFGKFINLLLGE